MMNVSLKPSCELPWSYELVDDNGSSRAVLIVDHTRQASRFTLSLPDGTAIKSNSVQSLLSTMFWDVTYGLI